VEQQLADLNDAEWRSLSARVRPPTSTEKLREAAGKLIGGDRLDAFMSVANVKAFADDSGDVDESKVARHLGTLFDIPQGPSHQNFGQYTQPPQFPGPGEAGIAEARKRFGAKDAQPEPVRGRAGVAEAEKRFGRRPS
jgi:hypothetical protein